MNLTVKITECDCKKCSRMCHAPCTGTTDDMEALMDAGYGNRLMYDDLPGGENLLKPALKGYEGKYSPWETSSNEGCTFWKDGKCELHNLGLKPLFGKLAIHNQPFSEREEMADFINQSWMDLEKSNRSINRWKEINNILDKNED